MHPPAFIYKIIAFEQKAQTLFHLTDFVYSPLDWVMHLLCAMDAAACQQPIMVHGG